MAKFAFKKGWDMVPKSKLQEVRTDLMAVLGITSLTSFYSRMKGIPEPTMSEGERIQAVFAEYGITDIWGE